MPHLGSDGPQEIPIVHMHKTVVFDFDPCRGGCVKFWGTSSLRGEEQQLFSYTHTGWELVGKLVIPEGPSYHSWLDQIH